MNKNDVEAIYPLSPVQQGMLFHTLYAPQSDVYFEQLSCTLDGDLHVPAFKQAWQQVVDRHPILRTLFVWENLDKPLQIVRPQVTCPWVEQDWQQLSPIEQQEQLADFLRKDRAQGFKLTQAPLMRLTLIRISQDTYHFIWSHHHLLLDGWSLSHVLKEVLTLYEAYRQNQSIHLEPSRPYRDYISWLLQQDLSKAEAFWREELRGFTAPTPLGVDRLSGKSSESHTDYAEHHIRFSRKTTTALQSLARRQQLTLNTIMQGTWAILLSHYSGEKDVVFGATVAGHPASLEGVESIVGLFINTLPVRVQVLPELALLPWLKALQARQIEARQYEHSPLVQVQGWSDIPRGQPLFESILVFENYPVDSSVGSQEGNLEIRNAHMVERTNYPLTISVIPGLDLQVLISYDCNRFDADSITRLLGHYQTLVEGIVANPQQQLAELPLLTQAEHHHLLHERNATQTPYPQQTCLHQLFETQVAQTPDAVAVVFEQSHLTYRVLDERASRLSTFLQTRGIGPQAYVGVCLHRSLEMLIALLGILKTGGAFLPLDPAFPAERMAFMLQDTQAPILLTQHHLLPHLQPLENVQVICLDDQSAPLAMAPTPLLPSRGSADDLAYVMYTSGSTGKPKGVLIPHRGIVNYLVWAAEAYGALHGCGAPMQSSIAADAVFPNLFTPLLVGTCVYMLPEDHALEALSQILVKQGGFSLLKITPTQLEVLNQQVSEQQDARGWVRTLVAGAEALRGDILDYWQQAAAGTILLNEYGPTETVVGCSIYQIPAGQLVSGAVPIGLPIANIQFYVLDERMHLVPIGVIGELYIGGDGLAWGYLNRPELTAQVFVPNPFSNEPGSRLYKTGDLVRYLPDAQANIEFLGRRDHQVKIRGYRVELGEIEETLVEYPGVEQTVVIARENEGGSKQLVAYVVAQRGQSLLGGQLREYLKGRLPDYMVPAAFVNLERLPLTMTGKVDLRALPEPERSRVEVSQQFVAPRTESERILTEIWAKVLRIEQVGIHDNFFELGGHSLLATQVISRVRSKLQVNVPLRSLFEAPTVANLAEQIEVIRRAEQEKTEKIARILGKVKQLSSDEVRKMLPRKEPGE